MRIQDKIRALREEIEHIAHQSGRIAEEIKLVAVSKTRSVEEIKEAYLAGCKDFGESRVQEVLHKMAQLPDDIRWHFIGPLQRNKVSKIIGRFVLIHSVDSVQLAKKISEESSKCNISTDILLEVNTSQEKTKHGLSVVEWEVAFTEVSQLPHIHVRGLMTMAPITEEEVAIRNCFSSLRLLRDRLRKNTQLDLSILSMGMSHDYKIAIEEGSTLVRIGSAIFTS